VQQARFGRRLAEAAGLATYLPRIPVREALPALRLLGPDAFRRAGNRGALPTLLRAMAVAGHARRTNADFIHAHWPRPSEVACLASALTGIPFGISVHAHEVMHDAGHFPEVLPRAALASFCNAAAMRLLADRCPVAAERFHLHYHGVDPVLFEKKPIPPIDGVLRIAAAGRLTPTKGFGRLILAVARTCARKIPVHLTIVGDGAECSALEAFAKSLGVVGQISFRGWVPQEDMPALLAETHLFALLPDTNFHDGLPNVVLEAMALGRPAILSALPASAEAIEDGVEGFILRAGAPADAFADICASLIADPARLARMGAAAAARVRRQHDRNVHLDRFVDLIDRSAGAVPAAALRQ
jgi:glycosyltransferase involved in cell wall biosynthesis